MTSVPTTMLRLDRSKPFSECRGERTVNDPHYRVTFLQGQKVNSKNGPKMILLPFDANGELVPDDGKVGTYQALDVDGKPVTHHPLYSDDMRDLLARKTRRITEAAAPVVEGEPINDGDDSAAPDTDPVDDVNFESWLRGEIEYQPHLLRAAAKKRYAKNYVGINELVVDLVLDEKLVSEDMVTPRLKAMLPKAA